MLADDSNVRRYKAEVDQLLQVVCVEDGVPYFVSDEATILDVTTSPEADLVRLIASAFGHTATHEDLTLPVWQLATKLLAAR